MRIKVILTLILFIALGFVANVSLYSKSQKQSIASNNPLKSGTDAEFSRLFNQALEYKDTGKEKEFEDYMLKAYSRSEDIKDDLLECISLCLLGINKIEEDKIPESLDIINKIKVITDKPQFKFEMQKEIKIVAS